MLLPPLRADAEPAGVDPPPLRLDLLAADRESDLYGEKKMGERKKTMKVITICQPYAELILLGEKRVENRTWPTNYRGTIGIHAGKSKAWHSLDFYLDYAAIEAPAAALTDLAIRNNDLFMSLFFSFQTNTPILQES